MSRTDHARPRRVVTPGHRTTVIRFRCFDDVDRWQALCSCGRRAPKIHDARPAAERDAHDHRTAPTEGDTPCPH